MTILRTINGGGQEIIVAISLSDEEAERTYREVEHNYLIQDACIHLDYYYESNGMEVPEEHDSGFIGVLVERYDDERDCNIPENDTWYNIIDESVRERNNTGE